MQWVDGFTQHKLNQWFHLQGKMLGDALASKKSMTWILKEAWIWKELWIHDYEKNHKYEKIYEYQKRQQNYELNMKTAMKTWLWQ